MYALEKALIEKPIEMSCTFSNYVMHNMFEMGKFYITFVYNERSITTVFYCCVYDDEHILIDGVLHSLLNEAKLSELSFDEYSADFMDKEKAIKLYKRCKCIADKLKYLLGDDFEYFMENNEY